MKKQKRYVFTTKKQPFFMVIKLIVRLFIGLRKPKVLINQNEKWPTDGLIVGPHMAKKGPYYISNYYPKKCAIIGSSPMVGSYKERWHYLRDVYYMQKNKKSKFNSSLKATFEAFFSIYIYKGMHLIPSYEDMRLMNTIKDASDTMKNGLPIFIFPENSDNGYQMVMKEFHEGYITLAKFISKRLGREIPIYPYYVHVQRRVFVIGKPFYLSQLEGKTNQEICQYTMEKINELNPNLEEDKKGKTYYYEIY